MTDQKAPIDPETVLITLDQLSQTVEVLNNSIARLQRYVQTHLPQQPKEDISLAGTTGTAARKKALH